MAADHPIRLLVALVVVAAVGLVVALLHKGFTIELAAILKNFVTLTYLKGFFYPSKQKMKWFLSLTRCHFKPRVTEGHEWLEMAPSVK